MKLAPVSGQPRPLRQGSSGLGDAYYPDLGNGGYDALHYDIAMRVEPQTNQVTASSTMTARALEPLDRFNLDLHGLEVDRISIDGQQARFERQEDELIITPATPLAEGETFDVKVDYHGRPQAMASQAGGFLVGWKNRGQGIVADSQPDGSHTWFPCNDHPLDKATYSLSVDVPKPYVVAANGNPQGVDDLGERQVFHWNTRDPLASYLATVNVGDYVQDLQVSPGGVSIRNYFPPELVERARFDFARTPEMVDFFSGLFGPYPFETYGVVVVNDPRAVEGAMETQTLSLFMPSLVTGDRRYEDVAAHELAHHWFGNQATVAQWKDLWLHEGFA
ncbi:MAG: M1 family metallopeptidase, partial [Candidatus Eremiobacteraeota bacterium]|nr:M1 family metallopeptidase [Candidatus Eremiobacteraeota bacterium]